MSKTKKLWGLILVATLVLSFTACKDNKAVSNDTGNNGETSFSGKTLSIGIWGGNDAESAALNQVVKDFEEKTGAKVELKTYTDINTQIQADFIGKTAPDVFYVDGAMFPFYQSLDVMEPLDKSEMKADKFYQNLLDAFTGEDGNLYCMPKDVSTLAMYYNEDLLAEAGMSADDIPEALEDFVPFLTELQGKLDGKYGVGQVTAMTYNQDLARNLHLLERGASIIDEDEFAVLSSDAVVKNIEFVMDLVKAGLLKTPAEIGLGWNGEVLGTEKCVIMEEGNWVYGNLKQNYPEIKFGVKDMPSYLGKKSSMSFTVGYAIYANSKEKELAKEWIKYATGDGMSTWCSGAGCLPSRSDIADKMDVKADKVLATHLAQVEYAIPWQKGTTISIVNSAYQNYISSVASGGSTVYDAMVKADKQANDEIKNSR